ncbi:ABC transporter substrate-binding protein [Fusibacter sp. 3D3]|uniref:ABC transporter substrate-binding protein n=1 Tax=Fusibacter sp. 3D3 TaxID=1048380 RepID=UPI00085322A8|nr:ABC transporter substrate-binding protein [Fusibacter sp. 3D3]GAU78797.1 ABC-type nitrate/sulfonate/bicarbonate transport systems periplasmic components [Fusibacter sp. 3D3]
MNNLRNKTQKIAAILMVLMIMIGLSACTPKVASTDENKTPAVTPAEAPTEATVQTPEESDLETSPILEPLTLRAITPEGATTIAMLKMIHEQPILKENVTVEYESLTATDLLATEIMGEKTDFAIVPTNLAIKLYNKGVPYKFASINTHGNLYMITSLDITSWEDLKGKEIYMIGQGLIPDLIFRYLAEANGLDPDQDMKLIYLAGTTEVAPTFLAGKSTITLMPEPILSVVSTKDVPYTVLFDFQEEFEKATGLEGGFPQAGLMVKNTVIEAYPEVVDAFIAKLEESCTWVNENPKEAGAYAEELELGTPTPIIVKAMEGLNIWHENAYEHKDSLEMFYDILLKASPEAIGGKLPDEGFYYKK